MSSVVTGRSAGRLANPPSYPKVYRLRYAAFFNGLKTLLISKPREIVLDAKVYCEFGGWVTSYIGSLKVYVPIAASSASSKRYELTKLDDWKSTIRTDSEALFL